MSQKQPSIIVDPRRASNKNGSRPLKGAEAMLDEHEKISIRALVAYAAMNTGKREEEIQQRLSARFTATNIDHLPSRSYEEAIKFLVDLCDEESKGRGAP